MDCDICKKQFGVNYFYMHKRTKAHIRNKNAKLIKEGMLKIEDVEPEPEIKPFVRKCPVKPRPKKEEVPEVEIIEEKEEEEVNDEEIPEYTKYKMKKNVKMIKGIIEQLTKLKNKFKMDL